MGAKSMGFMMGIAGALVGAISMHFIDDDSMPVPADDLRGELVALHERMNQTEALLHEIKRHTASNEAIHQYAPPAEIDKPMTSAPSVDTATLLQDAGETVEPDMAVEEAIVGNIIMRLYDPAYTSSTTMAELMRSEEMLELSNESRERVVAEMVGMLNRGEIDAETFFSKGPLR